MTVRPIELALPEAYKAYQPLPLGTFVIGICEDNLPMVMSPNKSNDLLIVIDDEPREFARWVVTQALIANLSAFTTRISVVTRNNKRWQDLSQKVLIGDPGDLAEEFVSGRMAENTKPGNKIVVVDDFKDFAGSFPHGQVVENVRGYLQLMREKPKRSRRTLIVNGLGELEAKQLIVAQELGSQSYALVKNGRDEEGNIVKGRYVFGKGTRLEERISLLPEIN